MTDLQSKAERMIDAVEGMRALLPGLKPDSPDVMDDAAEIARAYLVSVKEIALLTKALHAVREHPDWSYQVVPATDNMLNASGGGWELNPEWVGGACGDVCFRRRKETQ
jgi:hypothetical protein